MKWVSEGIKIADTYEDDKYKIIGYGATPSTTDMSSTTTEHYGVLAVLTLLHAMNKMYKHEVQFLPITIISDSKETVERANKIDDPTNISKTLTPDYDLGEMIRQLKTDLPYRINVTWIKAHQDKNSKGKKAYGPLTQEAYLNCKADQYAKEGAALSIRECSQSRTIYSTTVIGFYDKQGKRIQNLCQHLQTKMSGEIMKEYLCEKNV